jgi:3-oxoacyl-[acyl-carrier-protein] synthase II
MEGPGTVITGVGLATSLGLCADSTWRGVLESRHSAGAMPALESPSPDGKGGFQAPDLPLEFYPGAPREVRYLHWTIAQALKQSSRGVLLPYPSHRCGIIVGTTLHGMRAGGQFLRDGDYAHLGNFLAASTLQQAISGIDVSGDAMTTCSACSSSLGSIALAITLLEAGELDLVISGGYDTVSEYAYAGFNSPRLVAQGPLRPFASEREGMKLGEGYGIVVLERAADAARRGVTPLARVLGFGETSDAHHLTQPHPCGPSPTVPVFKTGAFGRSATPPEYRWNGTSAADIGQNLRDWGSMTWSRGRCLRLFRQRVGALPVRTSSGEDTRAYGTSHHFTVPAKPKNGA